MYSSNTELYLVTRKYDPSGDTTTSIMSKTELQHELRDRAYWYNIIHIRQILFDENEMNEIPKKEFVPQKYRTKEPVNNTWSAKRWNEIWNSEK